MIQEIVQKLQQSKHNLPAEKAFQKLCPPNRNFPNDIEIINKNPKLAAVLLLLYKEENSTKFILLERQKYDGVHSAEIGLPGGKFELQDFDLQQTALRETQEEIGVKPEKINPIFPLSKIYIPPSNFWVQPFVGMLTEKPEFIIDYNEVQTIIEVNLTEFLLLEIVEFTVKKYNSSYKVPSFLINNHYVWGATAMILSEFKEIIQ